MRVSFHSNKKIKTNLKNFSKFFIVLMLIKSELDIAMIIRGYILQLLLIVPFTCYINFYFQKHKRLRERIKYGERVGVS